MTTTSYVFARQDKSETVIVAFNRAGQEKKVAMPAGSIGLKDGVEIVSLIGTTGNARVANGQAMLIAAAEYKRAVAFRRGRR